MQQKSNLLKLIYQYRDEICHLNQMKILSVSPFEKNHYIDKIEERTTHFIKQLDDIINEEETETREPGEPLEFTLEELAAFDGISGNPAYVAVNGIVYDMGDVAAWSGGRHFGLNAGRDLTQQFTTCHQGVTTRLETLPVVGKVSGTVNKL
ncbi:MAG: cytochrome [Lachnospiraceae bacterium]|jgi:predicted heme/steroid binding protein|nr:cytochrome [Lachnospiraceae bacterium]